MIKHLKLGVPVQDIATGIKGVLSLLRIQQDLRIDYLLQPSALSADDGLPLKQIWLVGERVKGGEFTARAFPTAVLGADARDSVTGYRGVATAIYLYQSGCLHVELQPKGLIKGNIIAPLDFYVGRIISKALEVKSDEEKEVEKEKRPSPGVFVNPTPRSPSVQ